MRVEAFTSFGWLLAAVVALAAVAVVSCGGADPPAPAAVNPLPPAPAGQPARAPPTDWVPPPSPVAVAEHQGFVLTSLGTNISTSYTGDYAVAFVVFSAPAAEPSTEVTVDPGRLSALDSAGRRYPVVFTELGRWGGVTLGAATFRPVQGGAKTLSLRADGLVARRAGGARSALGGEWTVEVARQLTDAPLRGLTGMPVRNPVEANGVKITYSASDETQRFEIERASAPREELFTEILAPGGAVNRISRAERERKIYPPGVPTTPPHTPYAPSSLGTPSTAHP